MPETYGEVISHYEPLPRPDPDQATAQRNRYRLLIFLGVFTLSALAGLIYTFIRPPVYQSTATLQVGPTETPSGGSPDSPTVIIERAAGAADPQYVTAQLQVLTSPDLLNKLYERLAAGGPRPGLPASPGELPRRLEAAPVGDSNIIELRVRGPQPEPLPDLADAWIETYMAAQAEAEQSGASSNVAALRRQLQEIAPKVAAKRQALEQFRQQYGIISLEGGENPIPAQLRGLQDALNRAGEKEANARAQVAAIREAVAQGTPAIRPQDQARIDQMELKATQLRTRLNELHERYTPQYLALDPKNGAMAQELERLEKQIVEQRRSSQRVAVAEAEQEWANARRAVTNLQQQLAAQKQTAQAFTARFAEHAALQQELTRLEQIQQQTQTRLAEQEVVQRQTFPKLTVLSRPSLPDLPIYPNYWRDAGVSLAGALLCGILGVGLYELLNRSPQPTPRPESKSYFYAIPDQRREQPLGPPPEALPPAPAGALSYRPPMRELSAAAVEALLEVADPAGRLLVMLLLSGLTLEEIVELHWEQVDLAAGQLYIVGASPRAIPLTGRLLAELSHQATHQPTPSTPLLQQHNQPVNAAAAAALLSCLAHDAGLADADDVNPQRLRHTYLAFLARQGARLTELEQRAGHLPPTALAEYRIFSPPGPGRPLAEIDCVYPALRV